VRVLSLTDVRFPIERANGIQTMETAHALAGLGHAVTLGVRPDTTRPGRDPFAFYGLPRTDRLQFARAPVRGPYALRRLHFVLWALARASRSRFDVVLTRDLGVAAALLRLPSWRRPPIVYESHGYAPVFAATIDELVPGATRATPTKLARLERRERTVWARAAGYISTTRVLADDLSGKWGPRPRMAIISNGVRLPESRTLPPPASAGAPVVAYAGHLYPWKGSDLVIRAIARVPGARALIVGGHPDESDWARVQHLARELGVLDRVTLTGFVASTEVAARLAAASIFVVPTVATPSARYTSPLKLFEYMSLGRPIVATDLPSVREILADDVNGLIVPPDDPDAMASAILRLASHPDLADRLARRAFADVEAYSWRRRAERVAALLDEATRA
jgi:glycosyltransferase involved in cell wall biosynthesis